jgi:hypothetical protein
LQTKNVKALMWVGWSPWHQLPICLVDCAGDYLSSVDNLSLTPNIPLFLGFNQLCIYNDLFTCDLWFDFFAEFFLIQWNNFICCCLDRFISSFLEKISKTSDAKCYLSRNYLPFQSTWVHSWVISGFRVARS